MDPSNLSQKIRTKPRRMLGIRLNVIAIFSPHSPVVCRWQTSTVVAGTTLTTINTTTGTTTTRLMTTTVQTTTTRSTDPPTTSPFTTQVSAMTKGDRWKQLLLGAAGEEVQNSVTENIL